MDKRFEKILICLTAAAFALLLLLNDTERAAEGGTGISKNGGLINEHQGIMRFHVVANSDSAEDQELKLAVRDHVLSKVQAEITEEIAKAQKNVSENIFPNYKPAANKATSSETSLNKAAANEGGKAVYGKGFPHKAETIKTEDSAIAGCGANEASADESSVDQAAIMREYICSNLPKIESWAQEVLELWEVDYDAAAEIGVRHIPAKYYGDLFFPEGNYEALTISLGSGAGQNWWCVVFPPLCLVDSEDSAYSEEFGVTEKDKLMLKFKTKELLNDFTDKGGKSKTSPINGQIYRQAIYESINAFISAPAKE